MKKSYTKYIYLCFILLGLYHAIFNKDLIEAATTLAIGLAFDPFDPDQKWNDRPKIQKLVLMLHLAIAAGLLGWGVGLGDKL